VSYLSEELFQQYRDKIYAESGIHFSTINRPILESRIKERLRISQIETPQAYFDLICKDGEELAVLLDAVTTNLTKFFRNESHFNALKNNILPELIARKASSYNRRIKIWSAGCSTGEEPYSIAIQLMEQIQDVSSWEIDIIASDISLKSLMIAKAGVYPKDRLDSVPSKLMEKYFSKEEDKYKISDRIRKLIRFDYHNLKNDNGERDLDLIFCRNVIIYFDRVAQEDVIKKFEVALNADGYLFIGHSESLFGMKTQFKFHKIGDACVYRKVS
jgi:chemotaxis protein methyltransferase CheR